MLLSVDLIAHAHNTGLSITCDQGNEPSGSVQDEELLGQPSVYYLVKKVCVMALCSHELPIYVL
jgi:hypothetical protein